MKAVGYLNSLPIEDPQSLVDFDAPDPTPGERDLLVAVRAISGNPVDTKVRKRKASVDGKHIILGWDAAGVVISAGKGCKNFHEGDEVYYAGDLQRPGSNAQLQCVDERIVGRKPANLSYSDAAAMPLTSLTAWELLFDRMGVSPLGGTSGSLLIIGGAGGVGSILTQLARQLTGLTVISTASRPETREWCLSLGAHHVIDHSAPMAPQLEDLGFETVDRVASLTATKHHLPEIAQIIAPQGTFGLIDDPPVLDINPFKQKSVSVHWEFMFTRSMFQTADMIRQHEILNRIADLLEHNRIRTTLGAHLGTINSAHLRDAHTQLESGRARGKIVLEGF